MTELDEIFSTQILAKEIYDVSTSSDVIVE